MEKLITLENGNKVFAYPSSLNSNMINSNDCATQYEQVEVGIYRVVN